MEDFVHLHVASGYSLRHGASHPRALVERAAEHGMDALALTDRDGAYGAVKFAKACAAAGVRPVFDPSMSSQRSKPKNQTETMLSEASAWSKGMSACST